jgi:preprotein translocase subunit SecG
MFLFLLIVQTLVAIGLISVILMQRSEGGGLTGGGSPSGLMTARGAADFLTRATTILATIFVVLSIVLAAIAAQTAGPRTIDPNIAKQQPQVPTSSGQLPSAQPAPTAPAQAPAPGTIPTLQPQQQAPAQPAAPANQQGGVPIAQ